ncbi:hypothetical protein BBJ28_00009938 [Nothophytophthora sp. Chile5]|nr:hypothetical protein BBJ28_00009938 [Nothophytophthora sp. Chile5]
MAAASEELLSFGSPRHGFSTSVHGSQEDSRKAEEEGGKDAAELLVFYRQRCEQFHAERETTLEHLAQIETSLKKANAALFQVKAELIDLEAQNNTLRIQEQDDRQKIQHLLTLTQPITEQVTFFRDCRPDSRTNYPIARPLTPTTYPYPSTMHIASEEMRARKKKQRQQHPHFVCRGNATSAATSSQNAPPNKVLRTVYMPNEQTAALTKTIENLQKQLESHQKLTETRIQVLQQLNSVVLWSIADRCMLYCAQTLVDGFAEEKAKLLLHQHHVEEKSNQLEKQVEKTKRVLTQTTKDYLVLRHKSQETERLAHEELHQIKHKCKVLVTEKTELTHQVREETEALREVVREEGNQTVLEFRGQALARERDLHILKEQYAAMQEACTKRIQDLQVRLTKLRSRYRSLDKRRAMEMEGFTRDLAGLKRHLQKLEVMLYGRGLTSQERQVLRFDENYALDANELSDEIAALQRRLVDLSADLADA